MANANYNFSLRDAAEWPLIGRFSLAVIVMLVVILLGYLFVIGGKINTAKRMKTEEYNLLQQWAVLAPRVQAIEEDKNQIVVMRKLFSEVLQRMPPQLNMATLLHNISQFGSQSGVYFKSVKPLAIKSHQIYAEMPIEITAVGNYHQLAAFISRLANLEQFVTFNRFSLQPVDEVEKQETAIDQSANERLQLKIEVVVYHSLSPTRNSL